MKYDLALIEKPCPEGLNMDDIKRLFRLISVGDEDERDAFRDEFVAGLNTEVFPIELEAMEHECSALGFISCAAAEKIDYDYSDLRRYIASILDDIENEHDDCYYCFNGIDIFLSR